MNRPALRKQHAQHLHQQMHCQGTPEQCTR